MGFTGFPVAALDFYDDLEMDNTKSFWAEHKGVYESNVRAPMTALVAELEAEFGAAKVFRPYRDVRFAKDKTPYKTHQGAFVAVAPRTGWYVQVSAGGVRTSAGFYDADGPQLAAYRTAVDEVRRGTELEGILADLAAAGYEITASSSRPRPAATTASTRGSGCCGTSSSSPAARSGSSRSCTPPSCSISSATTGGRPGHWSSGWRGPDPHSYQSALDTTCSSWACVKGGSGASTGASLPSAAL
jgi:hypothetical protein